MFTIIENIKRNKYPLSNQTSPIFKLTNLIKSLYTPGNNNYYGLYLLHMGQFSSNHHFPSQSIILKSNKKISQSGVGG